MLLHNANVITIVHFSMEPLYRPIVVMQLLYGYREKLVHDCYSSYFKYIWPPTPPSTILQPRVSLRIALFPISPLHILSHTQTPPS